MWILFFTQHQPHGHLSPSSHRMRDDPFLGKYTLKSLEIRKQRGIMMENGKYGREHTIEENI
jgi:hypothetical protein